MDAFHSFLHFADAFAEWTRLVLETLGIATIAIGAGAVVVRIARQTHTATTRQPHRDAIHPRPLFGARARVPALVRRARHRHRAELVEAIGQLAAIGAIRTALNYFLTQG